MAIHIRRATITDYPQIAAIASESQNIHAQAHPDIFRPNTPGFSEESVRQVLENPQSTILVAEKDTQIVGYVFLDVYQLAYLDLFLPQIVAKLSDIAVTSSQRSQNIGQQLFDASRKWAESQHAIRLELVVWAFNERAQAFYQRNGMQTLSHTLFLPLA